MYLSPLCKRHKAGHNPRPSATNTILFGLGKQRCLDAICCDVILLLDRVVQAQHFLYSSGGENQHRVNWAMDSSSVSRHAVNCATETKKKHFHIIYFISIEQEWLLSFLGEGATLHSLCLNPTVRFNSLFLCFVWTRVPYYFGGICYIFIGCEEFNLFLIDVALIG